MESKVYSKKQLYGEKKSRRFAGNAREAAFLLGGIGTGNISVGARGELRDFEFYNRPGKGVLAPYAFFSIWAREEGKAPVAKVLESRINPPYSGAHGFPAERFAGLPRLDESEMLGEYPILNINFKDAKLPVEVSLEAFTPFIPLNPDDSGIPAALLRYKVKNRSSGKVDVSIGCSMPNPAGLKDIRNGQFVVDMNVKNTFRQEEGMQGLFYECVSIPEQSFAVLTTCSDVTCKPEWANTGWRDGIQEFWDDFAEDGRVEERPRLDFAESRLSPRGPSIGSVVSSRTAAPGEEIFFEFVLSWYYPYRNKYWEGYEEYNSDCCNDSCCCTGEEYERNYYATLFRDAWDAGGYLIQNLERLEKATKDFHRALHRETTLPPYIIDAVSANMTVMRSPTCFRIEDGTLAGWEGCHDNAGCCPGTCTHVWNYAQTMAFLFPTLEQSVRKVEFLLETNEEGSMAFRSDQVFGRPRWEFVPAADGQMGTIMRLYREWKLSGDDDFLKELWDKAKQAMDFAFTYWDSDGDFVLDSEQHNTYDIEFYGPNSLVNSMFFGALKAMAEMAEYLGEGHVAEKYRRALKEGSRKMDEMLWDPSAGYYVQVIEDVNKYKYQYGKGCLSDQLLGQFLAHICGLGYILPEEHVRQAVKSIFEHNFQHGMSEIQSVQRTYALNDEHGLLLCSWPHGGRPKLPFIYSDEVWTGIEYQVAATLIYEGFVDEGLTIVKAVRDRHDGYRRNPWNEVECGHHYARSMASYGLLTALSGFKYDMCKGELTFDPRINKDNFSAFFCTGKAWGIYRQVRNEDGQLERKLEILYGSEDDIRLV